MALLCVNIDHVATIREARKTDEPDPLWAAVIAELAGADGIVTHLRGDRRHIQERDLKLLRAVVKTKLTLEMAPTSEMITIAIHIRPDVVTLVPERTEEVTTEGGMDVMANQKAIGEAVDDLRRERLTVSIFINPDPHQIKAAAKCQADIVELNTGEYSKAIDESERMKELKTIERAAQYAKKLNLGVHAGHGLTYRNIGPIVGISEIDEFSIGHTIVSRAVFTGMERAVREMKSLIPADNGHDHSMK
jgi:pyridoxine 5-phosphate synthase